MQAIWLVWVTKLPFSRRCTPPAAYSCTAFRSSVCRRLSCRREIDTLKDLGVEFVLNFVVGRSETIDELFGDGYEAIFVGSGAGLPTFIGVPGENANGVYSANEYLTRINLMKAYKENADTPDLPREEGRSSRRRQRSHGRRSLR